MSLARSLILTLVLSVLGAALGAWAGAEYVVRRMHPAPQLHEVVHKRLHLSADQERRLAEIERTHALRRHALEAEMRAANAQLAQAFQAQHAYTPAVQAAIDRFHTAMGELQKETIMHVIAMRAVLTPQQAATFDQTVVQALTEQSR